EPARRKRERRCRANEGEHHGVERHLGADAVKDRRECRHGSTDAESHEHHAEQRERATRPQCAGRHSWLASTRRAASASDWIAAISASRAAKRSMPRNRSTKASSIVRPYRSRSTSSRCASAWCCGTFSKLGLLPIDTAAGYRPPSLLAHAA